MKKAGNIPDTEQCRIVIVGGGFAGLKLARKLKRSDFQIVMLDRFNYHQFQPLLYQVATAGLEPSAISFPLRKIFQQQEHIHFRIAEVLKVLPQENTIETDIGSLSYDYLVIATGATSNYFGITSIEENSLPMKSVPDALMIRNTILQYFEDIMNSEVPGGDDPWLNIVIVGGGPTGVELAGALAEMKKYILPKDYPELDFGRMNIFLLEAGEKLLAGMSEKSSLKSREYLRRLGVKVLLRAIVKDFDGENIILSSGMQYRAHILIWAAGIQANSLKGFGKECYGPGRRIVVNEFNQVNGYDNIFALGDVAFMVQDKYPRGHPQVAQVAIQQGKQMARNLKNIRNKRPLKTFHFIDKGSLATIGRNLAVADVLKISWYGFTAWAMWSFVHLISIVGVRNKFLIFMNWAWNYLTYDQALRLLIKQKK